jgi:hypothetical protein
MRRSQTGCPHLVTWINLTGAAGPRVNKEVKLVKLGVVGLKGAEAIIQIMGERESVSHLHAARPQLCPELSGELPKCHGWS